MNFCIPIFNVSILNWAIRVILAYSVNEIYENFKSLLKCNFIARIKL